MWHPINPNLMWCFMAKMWNGHKKQEPQFGGYGSNIKPNTKANLKWLPINFKEGLTTSIWLRHDGRIQLLATKP
jgi:hypothetical protein